MKTLLLIVMLSVSTASAKELTLDQFVIKVNNDAEAGQYELDASEVCDFFKNELTTKQKNECEALNDKE